MTRLLWFTLALAVAAAWAYGAAQHAELGCITDSECAAYCPPPGDEPDCDGGPQSSAPVLMRAALVVHTF